MTLSRIFLGMAFMIALTNSALGQSVQASSSGFTATPTTTGPTTGGGGPSTQFRGMRSYRPWDRPSDPDTRKPLEPVVEIVEEAKKTAPKSTRPVIRKPVYRDVPIPKTRPIYVDVPTPGTMPLRTLGRPALISAPHKPGSIVALISRDGADTAQNLAEELGLTLIGKTELALIDAVVLELQVEPDQSVADATKLLLADARFLGAHPNYLFEIQQDDAESSPLTGLQYAPKRMAISKAHTLSQGENVTVAVIDTGVDLSHGEFAADAFVSFDAVGTPGAENEPHGTAMAGVISAQGNMIGMAPGAKILAVRAFAQAEDGRFLSDSYTIARAINWAVVNGADILNMSFAGPADPLLLKLMDELGKRNVLSVAAAGNNGEGAPAAYPAAHPSTIAVTATDADDQLYTNANRGIYVTVAAPGVDVIAPAPGNTYNLVSGTSVATAHMTGVVALMLSQRRDLTSKDLVEILSSSAEDFGKPGPDPEFGHGLVDAFKATQVATAERLASN